MVAHIYKTIKKDFFLNNNFSIVPIRMEDRYDIMKWRNEQLYHLRQSNPLTEEEQDKYFNTVVAKLFEQDQPDQILFSFLEKKKCIGYGGLVHINWIDRNAEISFIMNTSLEKIFFEFYWTIFLGLIEEVAFREIGLHKIYTYAYDIRPQLFVILEKNKYKKEAILKQHVYFEGKFIDAIIHTKISDSLFLRNAKYYDAKQTFLWASNTEVRKYSFQKEKIEWNAHLKWFTNKISDIGCAYYILCEKGKNIGSLRFDIDIDGNAMISYLIDPTMHGKGYGKIILNLGIERLHAYRSDVKRVYGFVHPENIASIKIFKQLGFIQSSSDTSSYRFEKLFVNEVGK